MAARSGSFRGGIRPFGGGTLDANAAFILPEPPTPAAPPVRTTPPPRGTNQAPKPNLPTPPHAKPVARPVAKPVARPPVKPGRKPIAKPPAKPVARPVARRPAPKPPTLKKPITTTRAPRLVAI